MILSNTVSFYIVAHADDWQLFMQPNAWCDLRKEGHKTVFIILTAGDAGKEESYWRAREEGAKSSVRCGLLPLGALSEKEEVCIINNKRIRRWCCNNTATYFINLPDGGLDGKGFPSCAHQSMGHCMDGATVCTVDDAAFYAGPQDLGDTLDALIRAESAGAVQRSFHFPDERHEVNPADHPDHLNTAKIRHLIAGLQADETLLYQGYTSAKTGEPLSDEYFFWKTALFFAYDAAVFAKSGYSTIAEDPGLYFIWCRTAARPGVLRRLSA